jgi:hypothetical protein
MPESQHLRDIVEQTRQRTEAAVDPDSALEALLAADRRRRGVWLLPVGAVLALAVLVGSRLVATPAHPSPTMEPAGVLASSSSSSPSPSAADAPDDQAPGDPCGGAPDSVCPEDRPIIVKTTGFTWRVDLTRRPLVDVSTAAAPYSVDIVQRAAHAGVTVLVGVDRVGARARNENQGARDLADWVAARPFVKTSAPRAVSMAGYSGWRLDVSLGPEVRSADRAGACNGFQSVCRPLLSQARGADRWEVGVWKGMVSTFTFVDTPVDVTVVWSWSFDGAAPLTDNARLIRTLSVLPD